MDRARILRIAARERTSTRYDQSQVDLRNVVSRAVNGKYNQETFTLDTVGGTTNETYWTSIVTTITRALVVPPDDYQPLSIYEYTSFVAERATQLSMGASGVDGMDVTRPNTSQAVHDLENGHADFIVRRHTPSGDILHFRGKDLTPPAPAQLSCFPQAFLQTQSAPIT